ncbi:MAG TPA: DUF4476 domain-containing protein [Chitinophagaceae bacterium]
MKAILLIFTLGCALNGFAQQEYFAFIQSEKQQVFYVRSGEKNYSSSSIGYAIVPHLRDSTYKFAIGFPRNQFPEQEFTVRISRKDRGFELKNLGEKGWVLFDIQSMELISPARNNSDQSGGSSYSLIKRSDDFARLMAGVVNDTAVLYNVVMNEPKPAPVIVASTTSNKEPAAVPKERNEEVKTKPDETVAVKKQDTVTSEVTKAAERTADKENDLVQVGREVKDSAKAVSDTLIVKTEKSNEILKDRVSDSVQTARTNVATPRENPESGSDSLIAKKAIQDVNDKSVVTDKKEPAALVKKDQESDPMKDSVLDPPALPVIYLVRQHDSDTGYHLLVVDDLKDSIDIFIAKEKETTTKPAVNQQTEKKAVSKPELKTAESATGKKPVKAGDTVKIASTHTAPAISNADSVKKEKKLVMVNSDCRSFASGMDVDKLRVRLIQEQSIDGRLTAAKKVFRTMCFSAYQIKALSEMFPLDEEKYRFLESAYPFVSDTDNFKELGSLLKDTVLVQRFRKMVRLD